MARSPVALQPKIKNIRKSLVIQWLRNVFIFVLVFQLVPDAVRADGTATPEIGGNFKLTDHHGNDFELKQLRGRFVFLFFGYTNCPDICPLELNTIASALKRLEKHKVAGVFVTVDPERDTVDRLSQYLPYFHSDIIGLTGTPDAIAEVANQYKVRYSYHGETSDYTVDHSSEIFVLDTTGKVKSIAPFGTTDTHLVETITHLAKK